MVEVVQVMHHASRGLQSSRVDVQEQDPAPLLRLLTRGSRMSIFHKKVRGQMSLRSQLCPLKQNASGQLGENT